MSYNHQMPLLDKAMEFSEQLQLLVNSNERQIVMTSHRMPLALMYWNLVFEHQQGMLLLLKNYYPAPAFALLRVVTEAAFRSFLVMFGTENQLDAIKAGTYQMDFKAVAEQIDKKLEVGSLLQGRMTNTVKALHGFTHNGAPQLVRQFAKGTEGMDIISNYTDEEVTDLICEASTIVGFNAAFTTEFLNLKNENARGLEMFDGFVKFMTQLLEAREV